MRILILNSGSSSLKFRLVDYPTSSSPTDTNPTTLLQGIVTGIGKEASLKVSAPGRTPCTYTRQNMLNHGQAVGWVWESLQGLMTPDGETLKEPGITIDAIDGRLVWRDRPSIEYTIRPVGLSGQTSDRRQLLKAVHELQDPLASLAVEVLCHRARKYLGAYLATMGGADAVVFGGGIGERVPDIRARICQEMDWCGLSLDSPRNFEVSDVQTGEAIPIHRKESAVKLLVI